jgi:hypothetical protein
MGYAAIALAFAAAFLGLSRIGATRLVGLLPLIRLAFYGFGFAWLSLTRRRVPPYQALWGPDPRHPGNRPTPEMRAKSKSPARSDKASSGAEDGRVGLADDRQITEIPHNAVAT